MKLRDSLWAAALLVSLLLAWPSPARAEPTVLLVRARDGRDVKRWRAAEERTREELRMLGIRVEELQIRGDPDIEQALAERGAQAAVRVRREGDHGRAEVWWIDPQQREPRTLELDALPIDGPDAAPLAALRTAELVHATVAPPAAPTPPPQPSPPIVDPPIVVPPAPPIFPRPPASPPPVDRPPIQLDTLVEPLDLPPPAPIAAPIPERAAFGLHAIAGAGLGSASVLVGGALALQRRLKRRLWLRGELLADTAATWRDTTGGSIRTGHAAAHVLLVWIVRERAVVSPRLGLGGGPGLAWALGRADDPRHSGRDLAAIGSLRGLVGTAIRLRPHLRVVVGADLELLLPPVIVEVADSEVARLGTLIRGTLGLEWGWPRRSDRRPIDAPRDATNREPSAGARATPSP